MKNCFPPSARHAQYTRCYWITRHARIVLGALLLSLLAFVAVYSPGKVLAASPACALSVSAPWWEVDLGQAYQIKQIQVVMRQDYDQPGTRQNFAIWASNNRDMSLGMTVLCTQGSTILPYQSTYTCDVGDTTAYRYVAYVKTDDAYSFFAELRVYA